jgi:hypothetical protein
MVDDGGDEVGGFENLEVALGVVVAFGAIDDGLGGGVPSDFLERERMAEEVFGEAFAALGVVGGNGFFTAVVDVEAGVFPGEEFGESAGADVFAFAQGVEEAVAKEFDGGGEVFGGHAVEAAVGGEKSVGGEDVEVGVEDEVVAESVDGGDGSEFAIREIEAGAEDFLEGFGGGFEEEVEEVAAFAEDAAENLRDGEDKLAVGDIVADGGGDPIGGLADAALVAGGAEVAALAGLWGQSLNIESTEDLKAWLQNSRTDPRRRIQGLTPGGPRCRSGSWRRLPSGRCSSPPTTRWCWTGCRFRTSGSACSPWTGTTAAGASSAGSW